VNDEVDVVQKNPLPRATALDVIGSEAEGTVEAFFNGLGDGQHLPGGVSVTDHEIVGEIANRAEVQNDDLVGLLVLGGLDRLPDLGCQRAPSCR